jgi:transposase InsO family protein
MPWRGQWRLSGCDPTFSSSRNLPPGGEASPNSRTRSPFGRPSARVGNRNVQTKVMGLHAYFRFYNRERLHQSLNYRTPPEVHYV